MCRQRRLGVLLGVSAVSGRSSNSSPSLERAGPIGVLSQTPSLPCPQPQFPHL